MGYVLRAVVGGVDVVRGVSEAVGEGVVELAQGFGLVPITDEAFDRVGGGDDDEVLGEPFWFLSRPLEAICVEASAKGALAYLEAELFGGAGTQAAVVWSGGREDLGPVATDESGRLADGAFNVTLRQLGADRGAAIDEFSALGLGRHRSTDDWALGDDERPQP
jgi:hypothetical protein